MKITPNIGPKTRIGYGVFGAVLLGLALTAPFLSSPWSVLVGLIGGVVIAEGAIGF